MAYLIYFLPALVLSCIASFTVKTRFKKYNRVASTNQIRAVDLHNDYWTLTTSSMCESNLFAVTSVTIMILAPKRFASLNPFTIRHLLPPSA